MDEAMQKIKVGKAGDGIPEMIKWLGQEGKKGIWEMFKAIWYKKKIPWVWENNLMIPINKKEEHT